MCDFGDMTPHTLVSGAQTTLTATASARADRRDCPSEAWGPRGKTHTPPLDALDRRGGAGRGRRYGPEASPEEAGILGGYHGRNKKGKGFKLAPGLIGSSSETARRNYILVHRQRHCHCRPTPSATVSLGTVDALPRYTVHVAIEFVGNKSL